MKRGLALLVCMAILCGCSAGNEDLDRAMALRVRVCAENVRFDAQIEADYGDTCVSFTLACAMTPQGTLTFSVIEPESIAGISGSICADGVQITFDDAVLGFSLMADGLMSPVSAPWILMNALRSGYVESVGKWDEGVQISVADTFENQEFSVQIFLDSTSAPVLGEIYWNQRRLLTVAVSNFVIG